MNYIPDDIKRMEYTAPVIVMVSLNANAHILDSSNTGGGDNFDDEGA